MKNFVRIEFPNGLTYQIPSDVIVQDRATQLQILEPHTSREAHVEATVRLFGDQAELVAWLENEMTWSDVSRHARLISFSMNLDSDFSQATMEAQESHEPSRLPEPDAGSGNLYAAPIELLMRQTAESGENLGMLVFHTEQSTPQNPIIHSAVVALVGDHSVIEGYMAAIAQFDQFMDTQRPKIPQH